MTWFPPQIPLEPPADRSWRDRRLQQLEESVVRARLAAADRRARWGAGRGPAPDMSGLRNGLPSDKWDAFDAGFAASAKEVGYEVRSLGGVEYEIEDGWWRVGPGGRPEPIPHVPEVRSAESGEIEYSRRLGRILSVK